MDKVPSEYKLDFIRGYFDGDGSVGEQWTKKSKIPMLRTRFFSGSEKMMCQIVEELYKNGVPKVGVKNIRIEIFIIFYIVNCQVKKYITYFTVIILRFF